MGSEPMEIIKVKSFLEIPIGFTGIVKCSGVQYWYQNRECHREDGPAIIYPDGRQAWYLNGKCHREDGPAMIYPDGTQIWFLNGVFHREDGPAIIESDGSKEWYLNGIQMTPIELFEKLSVEQKEKALWNMNQWK